MAPVWTRTVRWVVCIAAVVFLCGAASGTAQAQVNTGKISFSAGIDLTNAYFFRGLKQENEGFISQPYAELTASLFDAPDAQGLTAVSFTIGGWNSLHTGPSGSDGPARNVRSWYESDFYTGFGLTIDNWGGRVHLHFVHEPKRFVRIDPGDLDRFHHGRQRAARYLFDGAACPACDRTERAGRR